MLEVIDPNYLSGYVDGEGCFMVSFSRRPKLKVGWEVRPSFSVGQNIDRSEILYLMKNYFGCGNIRPDKKILKYEVRSVEDIINFIIPHFRKYPLISSKNNDFDKFSKVCNYMLNKEHLTKQGLKKIAKIAISMNSSGIRKFNLDDLTK